MPKQNLISHEISAVDLAAIHLHLGELDRLFSFFINLQPNEIRSITKLGHAHASFNETAHHVANAHPEILPAVFDKVEYEKDYKLAKDLEPIVFMLSKFYKGGVHTQMAASSDTLCGSRDIYGECKHNRDKLAGFDIYVNEMSASYRKNGARKSLLKAKGTAE